MKRKREEFLIQQQQTITELHHDLKSGITMKGALVSFALLHGGKDIENRTKRIKPGWYALHTGSSKIDPSIEKYVLINLKKTMVEKEIPKEKDLPHSCIVGAFHISGSDELKNNKELEKNGWSLGPICNYVDKAFAFDKPIATKGAITLGWGFDCIDKRNKDPIGTLKGKITKELNEKSEKIKIELEKLG